MQEKNVFLFLVAFMILIILTLFSNIGYATVDLTNSTNNYSDQESLVIFKPDSEYSNNVSIINSQEVILNDLTFSELGECKTFTIPVMNTSSSTATKIQASAINSNTEYFNVTCHSSKTILNEKSDEAIIEVSVQLIKMPINSDETAQIGVNIISEPMY